MSELQAREILGCSKTAGYKELKASYRRMIFLVHPDKAEQDPASQKRAKESSSRLNNAWEYIENREKLGLLGKAETESTSSYQSSRGRATFPHECDICGFAPATKISAPIVTSFIYFLRRGKYELNACKACGLAMSRMALRETLIKGWWGFGLFFVPHAIYRYFENTRVLKKIEIPSYRDPEVITLTQYPFRVPPSPFKEILPLTASAIALSIVAVFLFGSSSGSSTYTTPSMYFGEVGSCYELVFSPEGNKIQMVECIASAATLRSVAVTDSESMCPIDTIFTTVAKLPDGTVKTACLETF